MAVEICAFDMNTAPADELEALHALEVVSDREHLPDDRPVPYEEWLYDGRATLTFRDDRRFAAFDSDGRAIASAYLEMDLEQNTHVGWGWIYVHPDARRSRLGSGVLHRLVDVAGDSGRRSIGIHAKEGMTGGPFLASFGMTERLSDDHNRLLVADLDRAMLDQWVEQAVTRAAGYSLRFWADATPDDQVEQFAAFTEVMNTAPRGDLEFDDERMTPEQLREREARCLLAGKHWWTVVAVEDATGAFAGYTQLYFSQWRDHLADQGDTGVDPAHRNRGLGRWIKADMLLRLLRERPSVEHVDTWNAGSNGPMLRINHLLGFKAIEVWGNWQADVDVVAKALAERR